jgi:HKD family nuclease
LTNFQAIGWQNYWAPGQNIRKVLITTFGFDPDFFYDQIIPVLFSISEERGTLDHELSVRDALRKTKVTVLMDKDQYAESLSSTKRSRFENAGGIILPINHVTQHAKLWLIELNDSVRISVGSTNLTSSGFNQQIQYMWMAEFPKNGIETEQGRVLSEFLSTYKDLVPHKTAQHITEWENLINTTEIKNIIFVPVIPNDGKSGLKIISDFIQENKLHIEPEKYELWIQSFSVGQLNDKFIEYFKEKFHSDSLNLLWPSTEDIKENDRWSGMALTEQSASLLQQNEDDHLYRLTFDKKHLEIHNSNRLPHGKLFAVWDALNETNKLLIIGSSNFSNSGWTSNIELNVIIQEEFDIDWLWAHPKLLSNPYTQNTLADESDMCTAYLYFDSEDDRITNAFFYSQEKNLTDVDFIGLSHDGKEILHEHKALERSQCKIDLVNKDVYQLRINYTGSQDTICEAWVPQPFNID